MEEACFFVTGAAETTRANIEIKCICDHFSVIFFAGKPENKYVFQSVDKEVRKTPVTRTWRAWYNEEFKNNTSKLIQISVGVVGIAAIVTVAAPVELVVELLQRL